MISPIRQHLTSAIQLPHVLMVSWSLIQTFLVLFGPIVYTRVKAVYYAKPRGPPHPLTPTSRHLLNVLFITALFALASTFEYFTAENIFLATSSRLQTPTDVLFTRISRLRELTPADEILRRRLSSKEGRLLYATYGPGPLVECDWCSLEDPNTFLFYALPSIGLPHLLHITIIGIVTSSFFTAHGGVWRIPATIGGVGLFLAEIYIVGMSSSARTINSIARTPQDVRWTHWNLAFYRGIGIALFDALLGYAVYLSGTGRWTIGLEGPRLEEKLESLTKAVETIAARLHADNFLRQAVVRNKQLREKMANYWAEEEILGKEIMQEEDVQQSRLNFATAKMDMDRLADEAGKKSEGMIDRISAWRGFSPGIAD